ncbi:MAG: peptidase S8 and S53 subtilisin kexin sedolisin [Harvfovirus sp.]|uniref:Peptidase S8 and S53 subtilisin kexin sedolisin n=1 Tax=Harvfovirus sp. TaxID=2487768 RepID=A0A3G5A506_9VIRU|nr:MAG: peptidase S8 and S53 subtilisin kexin sedolisin [Harvfovirus sp.]
MCETKKERVIGFVVGILIVVSVIVSIKLSLFSTENGYMNNTNSDVNQIQSQGFRPVQVNRVYGVDGLNTSGKGVIIALVDAYGYSGAQEDFDVFCDEYNLPRQTLIVQTMENAKGDEAIFNSDWAFEQAIDIQWVHAVAPGAQIMLVQAYSEESNDLFNGILWAVNNGADIISMSWGFGAMSEDVFLDSDFLDSGVVFLTSSGDNGSIGDYPACSPYVIAVGGTSLILNSDDSRKEEIGWSKSGGGICEIEGAPQYQRSSKLGTSGIFRQNPDVSAVANPETPVSVYCNGWAAYGGTSVASPIWAGIIAHANEARGRIEKPFLSTVAVLNAIYSVNTDVLRNDNFGVFYDVVNGSTGIYSAGVGYDYVTGIGTPNAYKLIYDVLLVA